MNNKLRLAFEQISREAERLSERWKSEKYIEKWKDYLLQMAKFVRNQEGCALVTFSDEGETRFYFDDYDCTIDCTIKFDTKDGVDYHTWSYVSL